jgi:RND family efflux transporter MFP subunit
MIPRTDLLLILLFILLNACNTDNGRQRVTESPVPVIISPVGKISYAPEISLSGNIEGYRTVRLGFMVAGRINFIGAEEGERVARGSLLSSLDPESYAIAKELADIQVEQVQDEYNRLKSMHDNKSVSESDFAKISFGLRQARVQQKLHNKNLADTRLYSPIDGILIKKLAEAGEITGVGIPLFVVSDIRKVKVTAFIPEEELHEISIGQKVKVTATSMSDTFEGKVIEVGSAADPASRSFPVKTEVDNPGMLLRPGMIAAISFKAADQKEILVIPAEAVRLDYNDRSYVFVADKSRGRAFRRNVSTGILTGGRIEITSGLAENEEIVTGGQQKLTDGSPIIIK